AGPQLACPSERDRVVPAADELALAQPFEEPNARLAREMVVADSCATEPLVLRTGARAACVAGCDAHEAFEHGCDLGARDAEVPVPTLSGESHEPSGTQARQVTARGRRRDAARERQL